MPQFILGLCIGALIGAPIGALLMAAVALGADRKPDSLRVVP